VVVSENGISAEIDGVDPAKFERRSLGNQVELELSVSLVLFFGHGMSVYGKQVLAAWNEFLRWRGREAFTWARLGGGNTTRKMDASAYRTIDAWLNGSKPCGKTCWIDTYGGPYEELGPHAFAVEVSTAPDRQVSAVDFRLPLSVLTEESADQLMARLCGLAAPIDFLCGTGGYMLHAVEWSRERHWPTMKSLVTRYEGVEPDNVEDGEYTATFGLTGVNWLTFIGPKHLERLGGIDGLETAARAAAGVTPYRVGSGLALRAGERPALGDRNLGPDASGLAAYREVYELVKPAIFADPVYRFSPQYFNGEETVAWMHRFGRRT
jgi:hypothetical protein